MSVPFDQIPTLAWDTVDWFLGAPGPVPCMAAVQAAVACNLIYPNAISYVIDLERVAKKALEEKEAAKKKVHVKTLVAKRSLTFVWMTHHGKAAYAWREEKGAPAAANGAAATKRPPARPRRLNSTEASILQLVCREAQSGPVIADKAGLDYGYARRLFSAAPRRPARQRRDRLLDDEERKKLPEACVTFDVTVTVRIHTNRSRLVLMCKVTRTEGSPMSASEVIDKLPDPPIIRKRLCELATEANFLRRLLRLSERKPRSAGPCGGRQELAVNVEQK